MFGNRFRWMEIMQNVLITIKQDFILFKKSLCTLKLINHGLRAYHKALNIFVNVHEKIY